MRAPSAARFIYDKGILLAPIVLFLLLPAPLLVLGFFLTPFFYLTRWVALGHWVPETRVNALVLILLTMTAIGFWISPARDLAVFTAGPLIAGVTAFFFLADQIKLPRDSTRAARGLALVGFVMALAAPLTTEPSPTPLLGSTAVAIYAALPRIFKISNPNIVAGGIAILAPFALAVLVRRDWAWRAFGAVAFAAMGGAILLLDSRGALFALGFGIAVWATLYRRWVLPLIPLGLIALLALNQAMYGSSIGDFVYGKIGTPKGGTLNERQEMWGQAALLIRATPLFGIGLGAFPRVASVTPPYTPENPGPSPKHAHNTFFQIGLDAGIAGAVAFIALALSGMYGTWRAYRAGMERDTAIAVLAAGAILIAHGLGDTVVWGTAKTGLIFWVLQSLAISLDKAGKLV